MNIKDITALVIKISGVVLFVIVVAKLPEYFKGYLSWQNEKQAASIWPFIMPMLIPGVAAILLITFPYKITSKLIFNENIKSNSSELLKGIELILIRVLGLLLLYFAVSDIVFHVSNYTMIRSYSEHDFPVAAYNYAYLYATIAEFIFALWLLLGTKKVISVLAKIRK